jgi:hypothetical protein
MPRHKADDAAHAIAPAAEWWPAAVRKIPSEATPANTIKKPPMTRICDTHPD